MQKYVFKYNIIPGTRNAQGGCGFYLHGYVSAPRDCDARGGEIVYGYCGPVDFHEGVCVNVQLLFRLI